MDVELTPSLLQGWRVIRRLPDGTVYLRLPRELQRPIDGGCQCRVCRIAGVDQIARWDTLCIPGSDAGQAHASRAHAETFTVHMPEER